MNDETKASKTDQTAKGSSKASSDETPLIDVSKDGETLQVHPTTLAAHVAAGWTPSKRP